MAAIVSAAAPHYVQGATAVHGLLLRFAAREYERGADIRARENSDIRALFVELGAGVRDESLKRVCVRHAHVAMRGRAPQRAQSAHYGSRILAMLAAPALGVGRSHDARRDPYGPE